jgi:hypothetical protein
VPAFHNFLSFFAGGLSASEKEEEEQCMFETASFWTGMTIFNLVLELSEFFKQAPWENCD